MAVYKQFNTNEVVISPFKANKRFRFENNQVSSSDVQIEYYQSQQGTYLSGSYDTGFNTMQDGVNIFHSIKQLYYSNYLTSSFGDPMSTASLVPGPRGPQGENLGFDQFVGNITGPRFENFLQSSLPQTRYFAQFSASVAPVGEAGTDTNVTSSAIADFSGYTSATKILFSSMPSLNSTYGINETYVLSHVKYIGGNTSPFTLTTGGTVVSTVSASQLVEERISNTPAGLTLKNNNLITFVNGNAVLGDDIELYYLLAPRGPSVISIPSMLYGEAIQPSSFRFEYTSSLNYTKSIVDDDGQGNLIVTQSKADGTPFFSGSVGQIFYSQGIAVITGPDSGSLREFAHNVGYKNNMNPNIISSSIAYSSSITIDENQYKCTVKESEFTFTTNPSALGVPGVLTTRPGQLFSSFNAGNLAGLVDNTYAIEPKTLLGTTNASTYYVFKDSNTNFIGQQYRLELVSAGGRSLEFVGYDGNENGTRNALGQVQFNSTGSAAGVAQGFCNAINSVDGFNGEISCSLFTTNVANDSVHLIQSQAGEIGNTRIKYSDSFNLLTNQDANYAPQPQRGQEYFGNTLLGQAAYNVNGIDTFAGTKGAILNVVVAAGAVTSIEVSQSLADNSSIPPTLSETFGGRNYSVGDKLEIAGSDLGGGTGNGFIKLLTTDVDKSENTQVYHDFCTGSLFTPYVTTVGLYNESNDLVCVGKLPRPIPMSLSTDTTFMINFDTN